MTSAPAIRVILADDHLMFVESLAEMLTERPEIDFCGCASDGVELLTLMAGARADVALMDVSMPGPGWAAILSKADAHHPDLRVVALTVHSEPYVARQLLDAGAAGYVLKNNALRDLLTAINLASRGERYVSPSVAADLKGLTTTDARLSMRECECLAAAARGAMSQEIAHRLGIAERTVEFHMTNAMRKLGARHRTEAVAKATKFGLI